jgi:hypothetical protein
LKTKALSRLSSSSGGGADGDDDDEMIPFSKPIPRKRKQSPNLIETRIVEARYMQWASSVYLRFISSCHF